MQVPPPPSSQSSTPTSVVTKSPSVIESCDKIKDEFEALHAQNANLKLELEKLRFEKSEIHRFYMMYYEMACSLNVEVLRHHEVSKRLNTMVLQIMPYLDREHQQQVAMALDRAKQVTPEELNAIISSQLATGGSMNAANAAALQAAATAYGQVSNSASNLTHSATSIASSMMALNLSTNLGPVGGPPSLHLPLAAALPNLSSLIPTSSSCSPNIMSNGHDPSLKLDSHHTNRPDDDSSAVLSHKNNHAHHMNNNNNHSDSSSSSSSNNNASPNNNNNHNHHNHNHTHNNNVHNTDSMTNHNKDNNSSDSMDPHRNCKSDERVFTTRHAVDDHFQRALGDIYKQLPSR